MPKPQLFTWACRCGIRYSVKAKDQDLSLLPHRFRCGMSKCRYYMVFGNHVPGPVVRALDLYHSYCGLGMAAQKRCSPAELRKLLGKKIVRMDLEESADKDRSLIRSFTLEEGITVHLAPSTKGVTVYKVVRE